MILLISALKEEIKPIIDEMDITESVNLRPAVILRGEYLGKEVVIAHTGVGLEKMRRASSFCMKEYKLEVAINIGFCGALTPDLSLGEIVIAKDVIYENNFSTISCTYKLPQKNSETVGDLKISRGAILTVDKVVVTPHEKAYLGTKFGAKAVDMESYGFAAAATETNTPFAIIRSVLDPMDMHLPEFPGTIKDGGETSVLGAIAGTITHPKNLYYFPQLRFASSKAKEALMEYINEVIKT